MRTRFSSLLVVSAVISPVCMAEIPEGDVFLEIVNGRVALGRISEDGSTIDRGVRVFYAAFGEDLPNVAGEPGFQSQVGAFDPAGYVGFNFRRALRTWNGVEFSTLAASTLTATYGPLSATSPFVDGVVPAMQLPVEPDGEFHEHPVWTLDAPASNGVYLIELDFYANNASASEPAWLLFGQNVDEATAQSAYDWAAANVPTPGASALLFMGAAVGVRRRRR